MAGSGRSVTSRKGLNQAGMHDKGMQESCFLAPTGPQATRLHSLTSPFTPSEPVAVLFLPRHHTHGEVHTDDGDLLKSSTRPQSPSR